MLLCQCIIVKQGITLDEAKELIKKNKSKNYKLGFGKTHPSPRRRLNKAKKNMPKETYDYKEESRISRFEIAKQYF